MPIGTIVQINVSGGGVPKLPVDAAEVGNRGILTDDQADKVHHGSPEQALCFYSMELIAALQSEGHPIEPGSTGENLTISGLPWSEMVPGVRLRLGPVLAELTDYATPCGTIRGSFKEGLSDRIHQDDHPGWSRVYGRVLEGGMMQPGDPVEFVR